MSIVIFEDVTTESALTEMESKCESYKGLYVDMDNAPERKYVKDMAAEINGLMKKLDRARIDKSKEYKSKVEKEAEAIRLRLEAANLPFTLLIDEHNKKRAAILAKEKAAREAAELKEQIEKDHEFALLVDTQMVSERLQREKEKSAHEQSIKDEAAAKAIEEVKAAHEREEQDRVNALNARLADKAHKSSVNNAALAVMREIGISEDHGKELITAIYMGKVPNVKIGY